MNEQVNPFSGTQGPQPSTQPRVFRTPEANKYFFKKFLSPKYLFIGLGIIIAIELVIASKSFQNSGSVSIALPKQQVLQQPKSVLPLGGSKIALISDKKTHRVGEEFPVFVRMFTGGSLSDGIDLELKYDQSVLEASSSSIVQGSAFNNYPVKNVDNKQGFIKISAISPATGNGFNGVANFVIINFKAVKTGNTNLKIQFTPGSTNETNVIKQGLGEDMLTEVSDLNLNVSESGGTNVEENMACSQRTYQSCVDNQGRIGTYWCTSLNDSSKCTTGCFKEESGTEMGCNVISTK